MLLILGGLFGCHDDGDGNELWQQPLEKESREDLFGSWKTAIKMQFHFYYYLPLCVAQSPGSGQ